jgi:hypothetical protein
MMSSPRKSTRWRTLGVAALAATACFGVPSAFAETSGGAPADAKDAAVSAEVIVLAATNDGSGLDPKIGKMPELLKPPLSSYNSYKLLDRSKVSLVKGTTTTTRLPNTRDLKITLKEEVPAKDGEPAKYVITASIQKADGNAFLPKVEVTAKPGETFFVAGQKHGDGVLVIGIKVLAP